MVASHCMQAVWKHGIYLRRPMIIAKGDVSPHSCRFPVWGSRKRLGMCTYRVMVFSNYGKMWINIFYLSIYRYMSL